MPKLKTLNFRMDEEFQESWLRKRQPLCVAVTKAKRIRQCFNHLKGINLNENNENREKALKEFNYKAFTNLLKNVKPVSKEERDAKVDELVEAGTFHGQRWENTPFAPVRATDINNKEQKWPRTFQEWHTYSFVLLSQFQDVLENKRVAKLIGINQAARTTCVKPAGTTSLVLGTSSGIHAWHNDYYIRRLRVGKNESIYHYLLANHPELVPFCCDGKIK